jgi:GTP-binding protein
MLRSCLKRFPILSSPFNNKSYFIRKPFCAFSTEAETAE